MAKENRPFERRPIVILPLSRPETRDSRPGFQRDPKQQIQDVLLNPKTDLFNSRAIKFADRNDHCHPLLHHNWIQPLRAIYHGLRRDGVKDRNPRIILVHSNETGVELGQLFVRLAKQFIEYGKFAQTPDIMSVDFINAKRNSVDFEDLFDVRDILREMVRSLADEGFSRTDIHIDCTGGQKPFSIGAALAVSAEEGTRLLYVPTFDAGSSHPATDFDRANLNNQTDKIFGVVTGLPF